MTKQKTQKINEALTLLNEAALEKKEDVAELLSSKYAALKEVFHGLESEVAKKARHGAEHLGEIKDAAAERVKDTATQVDRKVHEDPWKAMGLSVLGAFAIGFLVGRKK